MIRAVTSYSTHNVVIPVENVVGVVGVGDGMLRSVEEPTRGSDVLVGTGGKNRGNNDTCRFIKQTILCYHKTYLVGMSLVLRLIQGRVH